jgi:hypothetical protein
MRGGAISAYRMGPFLNSEIKKRGGHANGKEGTQRGTADICRDEHMISEATFYV